MKFLYHPKPLLHTSVYTINKGHCSSEAILAEGTEPNLVKGLMNSTGLYNQSR